jgi:hypothetical protein
MHNLTDSSVPSCWSKISLTDSSSCLGLPSTRKLPLAGIFSRPSGIKELTASRATSRLARATALTGDPLESRKAYAAFLALWLEADADLPILREARREAERPP